MTKKRTTSIDSKNTILDEMYSRFKIDRNKVIEGIRLSNELDDNLTRYMVELYTSKGRPYLSCDEIAAGISDLLNYQITFDRIQCHLVNYKKENGFPMLDWKSKKMYTLNKTFLAKMENNNG